MVRTVHWLQHIFLVLLRSVDGLETILAIMCIVTRGNVKVLASYMRCYHFQVTKTLLYLTQHVLQAQAQLRTLRQPDGQSLTYSLGEEEQIHLLTDLTMVTFLGFLQHYQVLIKHFLLWERDAIDTSHLLTICVTSPESTSHTCYLQCLDGTC